MAQRLPIVNNDDGVWGGYLLDFLTREHYDNGGTDADNGRHKTVTIRAGTASAGTAPLKFDSGTLLSSPEAGAVEFNTDSIYFTITTGTVRKKFAIYDDTSGATGDTYYRDSSGNFVRRAIGTDGKTMRVVSGLPTWTDATYATRTETSNYTVTGTDVVVFADASGGNVTVTLPVASSLTGYRFFVKRIDSSGNTCSIARSSSDTIDGATSISLSLQYTCITVVSNGSNWFII